MISFTKRQLTAITDFCDKSKLNSGISYFGNSIEASSGPIAIRIQHLYDGIKEEKIRIPKIALLAAIAAMDKDDMAIITADCIKVNQISIGFEPLESLLIDDLTQIFERIDSGMPNKFILFNGTLQNKVYSALSAFGILTEKQFGYKERALFMSGSCDSFEIQVGIAGIKPNEEKDA